MKKIKITTIVLILCGMQTFAQDANFSQYYATPLYLNPALTGLETNQQFALNYRSQWKSLTFPHYIGQASFIYPVFLKNNNTKEHQGGLGVSVFNEIAGEDNSFKNYGGSLSAAYNVMLGNGSQMISFGLQGAFVQNSIDFDKLTWGSQYDPYLGFDPNITPSVDLSYEQTSYISFNAGLVYYFSTNSNSNNNSLNGFLGFATQNINQPKNTFFDDQQEAGIPYLFKLHGGLDIKSSDQSMSISPNFLILQQHEIRQYNVGSYFIYKILKNIGAKRQDYHLVIGSWYRLEDAFIVSTGLSTPNYRFGFSYDSNVSSLRFNSSGGGAFEISINYSISKEKKIKKFSTPLI